MKLKDLMEQYGEYTVPDEWIDKLEKPKPKTVWDLKDGDSHVWVDSFGEVDVDDVKWEECECDRQARAVGNVFLTEEEAEKDIERRKVEALLLKHGGRRWFKDGVANWLIVIAKDGLTWFIHNKPIQGVIYFDSEIQAEKAISEIGEERLKQALFEVR